MSLSECLIVFFIRKILQGMGSADSLDLTESHASLVKADTCGPFAK